ncbi:MAG: hypothetical protein ACLFV1_05675, partial [Thiohalophilus sp.]
MKKTEAQLSETQNSWRILTRGLALVAAMGLAGCVDSDENTISADSDEDTIQSYTTNSPAAIAQESDTNYDNNVNGLISGSTLTDWIDDWEANRPEGITGDLVIMHVSVWEDPGNGDAKTYITPDAANGVRSYAIDTNRLVETRSNGVIETRSMVPSGAQVDEILKDYDLDPTEDMIVWAMGTGGPGFAMRQGRGWYMLRYWGAEKEHLALLNGGANHEEVIPDSHKGTSVTCDENVDDSCLPGTGTVSVRDLPEDNTALQATLEDVMAVARDESDAFLWDARSQGEYWKDSYTQSDGDGANDFNNFGSKQGHPNNAVLLSYGNLLISDDQKTDGDGASYRYRPKDELETFMAGGSVTVPDGDGGTTDAQFERYYSDSGAMEPLRSDDIYVDGQTSITYCETTFRAMITGVASAVVLGMPNRFYDGAMVEWNSLSHIQDKDNNFLLPSDSPWRTDKDDPDTDLVSHFEYNDPAYIETRTIDDPYADHSKAIINEDRDYKISGSGDSDDGGDDDGGGSVPPNPCGG